MIGTTMRRTALLAGLIACQAPTFALETPQSVAPAIVHPLMNKDLEGVPGKELVLLTVEYLPGGASLPHRHDAQVCVYVLEGKVTMQVEGGAAVTLQQGQTFYESRADVHIVSANASKTDPAKFLVFMVKDKNAPATRDATAKGTS